VSETGELPEPLVGTEDTFVEADAITTAATMCPTCGGAPGSCSCAAEIVSDPAEPTSFSFVYALGGVELRVPGPGVEHELMQAVATLDTKGLTDRQAVHKVLSSRSGRYLARQLCYVFVIEGLETYLLVPRDPADIDLLIEAIRPDPSPTDLDLVVGVRGPLAPPEMCNGLILPLVPFSQLYSFDRSSLLKSIPRPSGFPAKEFEATAAEVIDVILQMTDNAGGTDEHRALNWVAVRGGGGVYAQAAERHRHDFGLTAVETRLSNLSGTRQIIDVVLSYRHRSSGYIEKSILRVDTTELFPFAHSELTAYVDH
jgi:hypothetical protein